MKGSSGASEWVVVFAVGEVECALRLTSVRELLPVPRLWRPPGLPRPLEGFINLSGKAVPVVALKRLLGLSTGEQDAESPRIYQHLILIRGMGEGQQVALLVSRALGVIDVPPQRLRPVGQGETLNGCVEAEIEVDGGFVHLLAADRILLEQERQALSELSRDAQDRLREWGLGAS